MSSDLTARARLRDAAIALVAEGETPSARSVAARAEVSIGLIRHHFGTMDGLLLACDERIAALIKDAKHQHIDGPLPNIFASLQATGQEQVLGYLAHRLTRPSAAIDALIDQLVADAVGYWQAAIDAGLARPVVDLPVAVRMLTLYSLGSLVLHRQMKRLLDIDITSLDLATQPGTRAYVQAQFDLFSGLLSPELIAHYRDQLKE
ncbi:TetR/AcrR family transcriptional regulator [Arachnia propionica]|uniref:TetR/AcrR family transcriptional regulator n=1 Tax=Arachnia propionica TaxID=1750 RepID=A0A3P1T124_9ACTN|nr:TetR family transcriptional regulator [Arachnia propionica]MDO5084413.1 TetR family transcriptional regulator [Arachnia propionica]RRD03141.1 TetR/AcrR family transcriptional regulator [Arachnia propionica]